MSLDPTTIYLRDLPISFENGFVKQEVNEELLIALCNQYTQIDPLYVSVHLVEDTQENPFSYAYIQVGNREDAKKIISKLNFIKLNKIPVHLILFDDKTQMIIKNEDERLLAIYNLSSDIQVLDLYNICKEFGEVIDCDIANEENKSSDDAAYVLFRKKKDARKAKEKLDGASLDNHSPIKIKFHHKNVFYKKFVLHNNDDDNDDSNDVNNDVNNDDDDDDMKSSDIEFSSDSDSDSDFENLLEAERNKNKVLAEENKKLKKENSKLKKRLKECEEKLKKFTEPK